MSDDPPITPTSEAVAEALQRWINASERASGLAANLFQPGDGYGDPNALESARQQVQAGRYEADCLFRDYMLILQEFREGEARRHELFQQKLTWASFIIAAVVGVATIVDVALRVFIRGE